MSKAPPSYTVAEEFANSLTHGLGALFAIGGWVYMLNLTSSSGSALQVLSAAIYGLTLVVMFLSSTIYHTVQHTASRAVLRQVDHLAILYLIAGTYTPFTLITLSGVWGWSIFGVVWGLTILGTALQLSPARHVKALMVTLYLLMGWVVMVAIKPLIDSINVVGLILLVAGGVAYSSGVFFYVNTNIRYNHAIWHLFVLAGALLHYFTILLFVF